MPQDIPDAIATIQGLISSVQQEISIILGILQAANAAGVPDVDTLNTAITQGAPAALATLAPATPLKLSMQASDSTSTPQ